MPIMKQSSLRSPSRLQPPSHGHHSQQRAQNLHLPGLPRFHPAQYQQSIQSADSSTMSTPSSGLNSPQAPLSPRQQHRMYSDTQRQLYYFQRELMTRMHFDEGSRSAQRSPKPDSPRLHPLGSPGPVTPLELEEEQQQLHERQGGGTAGSYFVIGQHSHHHHHQKSLSKDAKDQVLDAFGHKEYSSSMSSARRQAPVTSISTVSR